MWTRHRLGGRFELLEQLGRGSYGSVYRALDHDDGVEVALKILHGLSRKHVARFKREFRELQGLEHRNIVQQRELLRVNGQWLLSMELVAGVDFLSYVREGAGCTLEQRTTQSTDAASTGKTPDALQPDPEADPQQPPELDTAGEPSPELTAEGLERLRDSVVQLARGLQVMHGAGRVHRDLKPANVRVTPEGRVVVVDFGLVVGTTRSARSTAPAYVGTPAYMAPELTYGGEVQPSSDMYALGMMIFQALTGTTPGRDSWANFLRVRRDRPHVSARAVAAWVPDDLEHLCVELTRAQPDRRLTAEAVVASLAKGRVFAPSSPWPPSPTVKQGFERGATEGRTEREAIGRSQQLQDFQRAVDAVDEGQLACLVVVGDAGIGKTTFMQMCCQRFSEAHPDAIVVSGRCRRNESIPLRAFDGVLDGLSRHLRGLRDSERRALMAPSAWATLNMFPALQGLGGVEPGASTHIGSLEFRREEAFETLAELLEVLADEIPLLVAIDDFHWADADSLPLLRAILGRPVSPAMLLLLTSDRFDATEPSVARALEAVIARQDCRRMDLGALPPTEAAALALQLQPSADAQRAAQIAEAASGHPMLVGALAQAAVPQGPLPTLAEVSAAALQQLDAGARDLVELCCVAARPLHKPTLLRASGQSPEDFERHLFAVCGQGWLRWRNDSKLGPTLEALLPQLAQDVSAQLPQARLRRLTEDLGAAFESS
ncbi:MAG: serine/threonine-protein kinase [Myxococcales bacterium]|nr:serine/threonine-protein kinase [Myxococcales bacterium]